jgi:hypothetical protein
VILIRDMNCCAGPIVDFNARIETDWSNLRQVLDGRDGVAPSDTFNWPNGFVKFQNNADWVTYGTLWFLVDATWSDQRKQVIGWYRMDESGVYSITQPNQGINGEDAQTPGDQGAFVGQEITLIWFDSSSDRYFMAGFVDDYRSPRQFLFEGSPDVGVYNIEVNTSNPIGSVPEPSTLALGTLGVVVLGAASRKFRQQRADVSLRRR